MALWPSGSKKAGMTGGGCHADGCNNWGAENDGAGRRKPPLWVPGLGPRRMTEKGCHHIFPSGNFSIDQVLSLSYSYRSGIFREKVIR